MTVEASIYAALKHLAGAHIYRDNLPDTVTVTTYVTFVQVGGDAVNFLESTKPDKKNGRFQVNVWAPSREAAAALSRLVEDAMRTIPAFVLGAPVATDEPELRLYGTRQDFSCWYYD